MEIIRLAKWAWAELIKTVHSVCIWLSVCTAAAVEPGTSLASPVNTKSRNLFCLKTSIVHTNKASQPHRLLLKSFGTSKWYRILLAPMGVLAPGSAHARPSVQPPIKKISPQILFCLWLKTPCKISEPYDNPFWEKNNGSGRKKGEKKTTLIVDT
jgi:hypothetical protein